MQDAVLPQFGGDFGGVVFVDVAAGILGQGGEAEGAGGVGGLHILLAGAQFLAFGHAAVQGGPVGGDFALQFRCPRRLFSDVVLFRLQAVFRAGQRR